MSDLIFCLDSGTTAVKAALFGIDGRSFGHWRRDYPTSRARGGIVEQNPQSWLDGIAGALAAFETQCDLHAVRAVGICSQVNTHVFVGADDSPLAPAMVWQDTGTASAPVEQVKQSPVLLDVLAVMLSLVLATG